MSCLVRRIIQATALQLPVDTPGRTPETGNLSGFLDIKVINASNSVRLVHTLFFLTEYKKVVNHSPGLHLKQNLAVKPNEIYDLFTADPAATAA
jgi:hypothetical protein